MKRPNMDPLISDLLNTDKWANFYLEVHGNYELDDRRRRHSMPKISDTRDAPTLLDYILSYKGVLRKKKKKEGEPSKKKKEGESSKKEKAVPSDTDPSDSQREKRQKTAQDSAPPSSSQPVHTEDLRVPTPSVNIPELHLETRDSRNPPWK
ncbi:hypothetical protein RHMOL_Rhmol01G0202100 [Rhododendron molle]|uniref:Uncharacterized protein n=1 Tax=Rhododendron molle TaxID=49168 RepID=A0ACC0Q5H3_RHOML|nr:hypothetical protein RHMOL_Rhmol01G0202100 [Rhododendron molle]